MGIQSIYGVVTVSNIARSRGFYGKVFGRAPDANPMPSLAEWHLGTGGLQVLEAGTGVGYGERDHVGKSYLTLIVDDLEGTRSALKDAGLPVGARTEGDAAGIAQLPDPDGNIITFAQRS